MGRPPEIPGIILQLYPDIEISADDQLYSLYKRFGNVVDLTKHLNKKLADGCFNRTLSVSGVWRQIERITKDQMINGIMHNGNGK